MTAMSLILGFNLANLLYSQEINLKTGDLLHRLKFYCLIHELSFYLPIHPPSTTRTCPDTYALDWLAKNTTLPLKSSGTPHLPAGILSLILFNLASSASKAVFISVAMYLVRVSKVSHSFFLTHPGAMALTVTPFDVHSLASAFVSCATAPFDAAYAGTVSPPWNDSKLAKFIMLPRRPLEVDGSRVSI